MNIKWKLNSYKTIDVNEINSINWIEDFSKDKPLFEFNGESGINQSYFRTYILKMVKDFASEYQHKTIKIYTCREKMKDTSGDSYITHVILDNFYALKISSLFPFGYNSAEFLLDHLNTQFGKENLEEKDQYEFKTQIDLIKSLKDWVDRHSDGIGYIEIHREIKG